MNIMMVDPVPTDSTSDSEVTRVGLRLGARTCNRLPLTREEEIANGSLGIFPDRGALVDDRVAESDSEADLAVEAGRNSFTPHQGTFPLLLTVSVCYGLCLREGCVSIRMFA